MNSNLIMPQASTSRRASVELHRCRLTSAKVSVPFLTGYQVIGIDPGAQRANMPNQASNETPVKAGTSSQPKPTDT